MKKNRDINAPPPFSYPVKVSHVSANAVAVHVEADSDELQGLAELWQVEAVRSLRADLQVARWKKDGVRVKGRVEADIVQACVVTLEPVESSIAEDFEQIYVPEGSKLARIITNEASEMVLDPEGPDLPEPFSGDEIDLGAAVAEFAALAIDPYPRKADASFSAHIESDPADKSVKPNPFAALKDWKKN